MTSRPYILILRIAACLITVAAIGLATSLVMGHLPLQAAAVALLGIAIGVLIFGISLLFEQRHAGPEEMLRTSRALQSAMAELSSKVDNLGVTVDRMGRARSPVDTGSLQAIAPVEVTGPSLQPLYQAIAELRELVLLNDAQRQERAQQVREQQKVDAIRQVINCLQQRQWAEAQRILQVLNQHFPGDPAIAHARGEFERARADAEAESFSIAEQNVESEMSLGHWDQAVAAANTLAANFPGSEAALTLVARVQREQTIFTETNVSRLIDEIRHSSDRREWRKAFTSAQRLLEKFPMHPKSEKVRLQIKTLQDNAEIEERQQQEVRIGELIRARRFNEAIQLSEDLLNRFPMSPQAEAIEKMLPRIKQLAIEAEQPESFESAETV